MTAETPARTVLNSCTSERGSAIQIIIMKNIGNAC